MDEHFPKSYPCTIDFKTNVIRVWEKIIEYENMSLSYCIKVRTFKFLIYYLFGMLIFIGIMLLMWRMTGA